MRRLPACRLRLSVIYSEKTERGTRLPVCDCLLILTVSRLPAYDCSHRREMRRLPACRLRLSRRLASPGSQNLATHRRMMGIMRTQRNEQRAEINDLKRKVVELEYKLQPRKSKQVMVNGCGIAAINGVYQRSGVVDDVPAYSKSSEYQGKRVAFKLFRCRDREQKRRWFISIVPGLKFPGTDQDIDFYFSDSRDENIPFPLNYKWSTIPERGVEPPPCIDLPSIYSRDNY
eukprot:scaffold140798_cov54-Cyclotella_meneghiniana.AAC.1